MTRLGGRRAAAEPLPHAGGLRGLVRGFDDERPGHSYGIGALPPGTLDGELGALRASPSGGMPGERLVAVRVESDGRIVAGNRVPATPRPSPSRIARWTLGPLAWRDVAPLRERRRLVRDRLRALGRRPWRQPRTVDATAGSVAGYLHADAAPGRRPLFSALHPVTGDQLLATQESEPAGLGYGPATRLGYLLATAPVTHVLAAGRRPYLWGSRNGMTTPRDPRVVRGGLLADPVGADGRDRLPLHGWAVMGAEQVARVELRVGDREVGRARLGMPRELRLPDLRHQPEAPISGFQGRIEPPWMSDGAAGAEVSALVTGVEGTELLLFPRRREHPAQTDPPRSAPGRGALPPVSSGGIHGGPKTPRVAEGLNLLAFAHSLEVGGAERYLLEQLRRLRRAEEFSCTVVALADGPWRGRLETEGIPVRLAGPPPRSEPDGYEERLAELIAWAEPQGFSAVLANTLDTFVGIDLAARLGLPSAWAIHESFEVTDWWPVRPGDEAGDYARGRCIEALGAAGALLFPAGATARLYEPYAPRERLLTAPLGLELGEIDAFRATHDRGGARRGLGIDPGATLVLCLGLIQPRKCQAVLARAWAQVSRRHPDAHLALVGDIGTTYCDAVRAYVEQAGLGDRCTIAPVTTEDAYRWHLAADLFALASDVESLPLVLLEAMAFETPVVATAVFGVPELITDGADGYLCEPNDVAAVAAALDRALGAEPERRREIALAGARRVRSRHDPDRYAAALDRLLRGLITDPGAPPRWSPALPEIGAVSRQTP